MPWSHTKLPSNNNGGIEVPELPEEYYWGVFSEKAENRIFYTLNLMLKSQYSNSFLKRLLNRDEALLKSELKSLDLRLNPHDNLTDAENQITFREEASRLAQAMYKNFFNEVG